MSSGSGWKPVEDPGGRRVWGCGLAVDPTRVGRQSIPGEESLGPDAQRLGAARAPVKNSRASRGAAPNARHADRGAEARGFVRAARAVRADCRTARCADSPERPRNHSEIRRIPAAGRGSDSAFRMACALPFSLVGGSSEGPCPTDEPAPSPPRLLSPPTLGHPKRTRVRQHAGPALFVYRIDGPAVASPDEGSTAPRTAAAPNRARSARRSRGEHRRGSVPPPGDRRVPSRAPAPTSLPAHGPPPRPPAVAAR